MGRSRLLCSGAQPHLLCSRSRSTRRIPNKRSGFKQASRVGAYTSAAIAAIAFGEKAPAVDTNVERVLARLNILSSPARSEIVERPACDDGEASTGRHRPGTDGSWCWDLPTEAAALQCLSAPRRVPGIRKRRSGKLPCPAATKSSPRSLRHRMVDRARRPCLARSPARIRPARRHGGSPRGRMGRTSSLRSHPAGNGAAHIHAFHPRPSADRGRGTRRRRLVAAHCAIGRCGVPDTLSKGRRNCRWMLEPTCRLRSSFPDPASTAPMPCEARRTGLPNLRRAMTHGRWSGARDCRRWTPAEVSNGRK